MSVLAASAPQLVQTGLPFGSVRWGAHLCQFYKTAADLEEVVIPYLVAGITNGEKCVWVASGPLTPARARAALAAQVPDLDARGAQVAIVERLEHDIEAWFERAHAEGFTGLRIAGDTASAESSGDLAAHDAQLHRALHGRRITVLCSYPLEHCGPDEIMDVLRNHKSALMRRNGRWEHIGSATAALALLEAPRSTESGSREHLVVLQAITSALGEAVSFDNVGAVVTAELAPAVGATRVGLVIGGQLIALRGITTPEDAGALGQMLESIPAQWTAQPPPELAWVGGGLVAVLALASASERIGTLLLAFERPVIAIAQRALVDDLVRQLAFSVERARVYEQATHDRMRAERASAAKDQFLAMLGHELRNPLSPILSATQVMRLRAPDQLVKERGTIEKSVGQMIRLVDDLLDVSQIARGDVALAREPVEIGELVERALETARGVIDERVKFSVAVARCGLIVDVDPLRIVQVLVKLIVNAAKYAPEQDVEIGARAHGEMIELVVRDHGAGIDAALLPYVFDLFVQGKQGADRAGGGLGVGLAIARSIVELHGGTITAASDGEGTGSTFTVLFPRWQTERNTDRIAIPVAPGGRKILVVDDNEDAAWLLAEALRLLGHDVQVTHEGISALELAKTWDPEVALLDIGLPGMNGFELCRELGKLAGRPHCIAVSGYGQPKDRAMAREAGFEAHFVKPVDLRDIQAALEALDASN